MRISDWSSDVCSSDLFDFKGRGLGGLSHLDRAMLAFLEENTLLCAPVSELGADEKCTFTEPGRAVPSEIPAISKSIQQPCKDAGDTIILLRDVPDSDAIAADTKSTYLNYSHYRA